MFGKYSQRYQLNHESHGLLDQFLFDRVVSPLNVNLINSTNNDSK